MIKAIRVAMARERLKDPRFFMVNDLARRIAALSKTLERDEHGRITRKSFYTYLRFSEYAVSDAHLLLWLAYTAPEMLRDLGEAICNAHRNGGAVEKVTTRPIAEELVNAYDQCTERVPTIPEVREVFIARKKFRWPGDFYARRTLRSIPLPFRPATRGAPRGPRRKTKKLAQ